MTTNDPHTVFLEAASLYAVHALPDDERRAFEEHLRSCDVCARELRSFDGAVAALLQGVPQIDPPASLRDAIVARRQRADTTARVSGSAYRWSVGWVAAAAMLVAALGLAGYTAALRRETAGLRQQLQSALVRLDQTEQRLEGAARSVNASQLRIAVLMAPDLARIDLAAQPTAPRAVGRAFWSRARGLVFTASALPTLPAGRTYQVWVITAERPLSAGTADPDDRGTITAFFATPPDIPAPVAMAVTDEPQGGVPAPTGNRYLVGAAQ
jgi:anti-sigma-K factor RskA